jgi:hypothetical protein
MGREWVGVLPADGFCDFRVSVDVAAEFAGQIGGGSEHAASDDVALHLREPQLDLIEPGRIGRREVQGDVGVLVEEGGDQICLVRQEIVDDDVDLSLGLARSDDLIEELNELTAGVPRGGLAVSSPVLVFSAA